jgi:hypothetical protein
LIIFSSPYGCYQPAILAVLQCIGYRIVNRTKMDK